MSKALGIWAMFRNITSCTYHPIKNEHMGCEATERWNSWPLTNLYLKLVCIYVLRIPAAL